jgi:hypothetical protein
VFCEYDPNIAVDSPSLFVVDFHPHGSI